MNLLQLQAFREVMLTGSVTEAAKNIGRTQPAISALIASLEEGLGYDLFERRGGRLHPIPEAQFLLSESASILDHLNSLRHTMQGVGAIKAGHLSIACMPVHAENLLPYLIAQFVKNRRDVSISLISQSSERVYERIASQRFDIGFAEVASESPLVDADVLTTETVCAVPAGDPLASKKLITPKDLDRRDIVSFLKTHFIVKRLVEIFDKEGRQLNIRFEVQNAASQYAFVEEGLACSIMSLLSAQNYRMTRRHNDRIEFIPFSPKIDYPFAILTPAHKPLSHLARAFVDVLKNEATALLSGGGYCHIGDVRGK